MKRAQSNQKPGYLPRLHCPRAILGLWKLISNWTKRSRDRERLAMLDDRFLRDIGLSRYDVEYETRKWFWQP